MKTMTLLLLCLFLGIGLTQLSAQDVYPPLPPDNHNGTGSLSSWSLLTDYYSIPVFSSNGDLIDWLAGDVTIHTLDNFKNGVWIWRKIEFSGDLILSGTGEVFSIKDIWKFDPVSGFGPGHFNARGNQGSHYLIKYIYDDANYSFIFVSAVWPGSKK